mmetsp:Transcript_44822/g.95400  ORF Transcript_44822/g.95400 Transcript_44822/m.95400 type:complete len:206 (+) Transcript_44822:250-867(+)
MPSAVPRRTQRILVPRSHELPLRFVGPRRLRRLRPPHHLRAQRAVVHGVPRRAHQVVVGVRVLHAQRGLGRVLGQVRRGGRRDLGGGRRPPRSPRGRLRRRRPVLGLLGGGQRVVHVARQSQSESDPQRHPHDSQAEVPHGQHEGGRAHNRGVPQSCEVSVFLSLLFLQLDEDETRQYRKEEEGEVSELFHLISHVVLILDPCPY